MRIIIAEKDKAAKRIAEILSNGKVKVLKEGKVKVYDIGEFNGEDTFVIPLSGHIVDVDFDRDFSSWKNSSLWDIVDAGFTYKPSRRDIARILEDYGKLANRVTIATDFDREGEAIGREALNIIRKVNPDIRVDRARFSAITPKEIKEAFKEENLHELDKALADSADARREIDLAWGAVLTRFISLTSGKLGRDFLSVGRVQTPTLALIVNREKEIMAFKPKKYWVIQARLKSTEEFDAKHKEDKIWDKEKLDNILRRLEGAEIGLVKKVTKKKKKSSRPTPFNTNDFLRAAANLGIAPARAMQIAENLYMSGLISYPRTDNTVYPSSLNLREILVMLKSSKEFGQLAEKILSLGKIQPSKGKKKTSDHPPIHPTGVAKRSDLDPTSWKVYELVVRRFLATLAEDAELAVTKAEIDINGEIFIANGQVIVKPGWLEFYTYSQTKENRLPELEEGQSVQVISIDALEKETQPPSRYTPAGLLKEMEKLGLGTKSTRPTIIQKLVSRGYVSGSKNYKPASVAFKVIESLERHAPDITKPDMTAKLEEEMERISEHKKRKEEVVQESKELLRAALAELEKNKEAIRDELRAGIREDRMRDRILGKCKKCNGNLVIRVSKSSGKRFAACDSYPECNESYPLPQKGRIRPTGKVCPHCGTPIIKVNPGRGKRSYEICLDPNCQSKAKWRKKK